MPGSHQQPFQQGPPQERPPATGETAYPPGFLPTSPGGAPLQVGPARSPGTPSINDLGGAPAAPRFDLQGPGPRQSPADGPDAVEPAAAPEASGSPLGTAGSTDKAAGQVDSATDPFDFAAFDDSAEAPQPVAAEVPSSVSSPDADPFASPASGETADEPGYGAFDPFGNLSHRPAPATTPAGSFAHTDRVSPPLGPESEVAAPIDDSTPEPGVAYPDGHPSAAFQPTPAAASQATPPPPPNWTPARTGRSAGRRGNAPAKVIALIAVIAVVVTTAIIVGVNQLSSGRGGGEPSASSHATVARPVPPGWTTEFAWSESIEQVNEVAVNYNRIALLQGNQLVVLDADTGQEVFRSTASFSPNAKPFIAMAQSVPVTGIIDGSNMLLWPLDSVSGAQPKQITLSRGARMNQVGFGLMVATGSENWMVDSNLNLVAVTIPGDHEALGVTAEGEMVSAPTTSSWQFNPAHPGNAPRTVRVGENAPDTEGEMTIAWLSRGVVAAWGRTSDDAVRTVGLYDVNDGRLLAAGKLSTEQVNAGMPLTVSPDGEFASAGPLLVRLADGTSQVVDRWSTIKADAKNIYGTRDGVKMVWTGQGDPQELPPDAVIPWGMSEQRLAIVLDSHPTDSTRFLLGGLRG